MTAILPPTLCLQYPRDNGRFNDPPVKRQSGSLTHKPEIVLVLVLLLLLLEFVIFLVHSCSAAKVPIPNRDSCSSSIYFSFQATLGAPASRRPPALLLLFVQCSMFKSSAVPFSIRVNWCSFVVCLRSSRLLLLSLRISVYQSRLALKPLCDLVPRSGSITGASILRRAWEASLALFCGFRIGVRGSESPRLTSAFILLPLSFPP